MARISIISPCFNEEDNVEECHAAVAYAIVSFALGLFLPGAAPRGTQTIIIALFFFSGAPVMFIGLLGEYIAAIHAQVRRAPMVVERERINIDAPAARRDAPLFPRLR
jgi:hypothetical protein